MDSSWVRSLRPKAISKTDILTADSGESNALLILHSRPKRIIRISPVGGSTGWTIIPVPAWSTNGNIKEIKIITKWAFKPLTVIHRTVYNVNARLITIKYMWSTLIRDPGKCLQPGWVVCHSSCRNKTYFCHLYRS